MVWQLAWFVAFGDKLNAKSYFAWLTKICFKFESIRMWRLWVSRNKMLWKNKNAKLKFLGKDRLIWSMIWPLTCGLEFWKTQPAFWCKRWKLQFMNQFKHLPGNTSRNSGFGAWIHPLRCWMMHWNISWHKLATLVDLSDCFQKYRKVLSFLFSVPFSVCLIIIYWHFYELDLSGSVYFFIFHSLKIHKNKNLFKYCFKEFL